MQSMLPSLSPSGIKELKQRVLYLLLFVFIFRVGIQVPLPGVDLMVLSDLVRASKGSLLFGYFDMFSGGAISKMSLLALSIYPYISASIVIQLLSHAQPSLIALRKDGESGKQKLNQYTRYLTYVLALVESYGIAAYVISSNASLIPSLYFVPLAILSLSTGTMFLVWIADQISKYGIGNGVSILMFIGIITRMPETIVSTLSQARQGQIALMTLAIVVALVVSALVLIVFLERAQRLISLSYPRRHQMVRNAQTDASNNHLPLKINMAGVLPPIVAQVLIIFPVMGLDYLYRLFPGSVVIQSVATLSVLLHPGQPLYIALFTSLVIVFSYFLTATFFDTKQVADHLKRSGAMITGVRPGVKTSEYIDTIVSRLTLIGALYLSFVASLPDILIKYLKVPVLFGGTSLLISVVVVMEIITQIQTILLSSQQHSGKGKRRIRLLG